MHTRTTDADVVFGAVRSAPLAYRKDLALAGGRVILDPSDGSMIAVAAMLCHASEATKAGRLTPLGQAVKLARKVLQEAGPRRSGRREQKADSKAQAPVIRRLVSRMEDAGALHLALTTLQALALAIPGLDIVEKGRILAQSARIAWKAGDLDLAKARYDSVARLGVRSGAVELRVRAWIGYCVLARLRGNYPEVQKWALRAARVAEREGLSDLAALAHHSLTVVAGSRGELEKALLHGWRAYQLSVGDRLEEADMLLSLGQTLLNAGDPQAARSGFAGVLVRNPPARIALPALGGYATASAAIGDRVGVQWAAEQVQDRSGVAGVPYASAAALGECASASAAVGNPGHAAQLREAALSIARAHGYHEVKFLAEAESVAKASTLPGRIKPSAGASAVARAVRREHPDATPHHIDTKLAMAR
jgi:hypothetical protein